MTRHQLNFNDSFLLMKLIESEHTGSKQSDAQFAEYASKVLNIPLNVSHVQKRRVGMGIPNSRQVTTRKKSEDVAALLELVRALDNRVLRLESAMRMGYTGAKV